MYGEFALFLHPLLLSLNFFCHSLEQIFRLVAKTFERHGIAHDIQFPKKKQGYSPLTCVQ